MQALLSRPDETMVESKVLRAVRLIVFEDSEYDIAELMCNCSDSGQMVLSFSAFLLIKG